jgi:hypothetical protein
MYDRLDDIPVLASRQRKVSATHFNYVQKALKYLGEEIRLPIPKLKHLDFILQKTPGLLLTMCLMITRTLPGQNLKLEAVVVCTKTLPARSTSTTPMLPCS